MRSNPGSPFRDGHADGVGLGGSRPKRKRARSRQQLVEAERDNRAPYPDQQHLSHILRAPGDHRELPSP